MDPKVSDVFWRIRRTTAVQTPLASWASVDLESLEVSYDPGTGRVQLPLPASAAGFYRLEIRLE